MTIDPTHGSTGDPVSGTVDTRHPAGPDGRLYAVSFARVWDEVLERIAARGRWDLVHRDEDLGIVTVRCRGILPGRADDLTVWVKLDDNGLTRVDVRCGTPGRHDSRSRGRRVQEILAELDQAFGDSRVRS